MWFSIVALTAPRIVMRATDDQMSSTLWSEARLKRRREPKEELPTLWTEERYTAAVVLGKSLSEGRLSIEHASRVSALVRSLKTSRPALVIFAPATASLSGSGGLNEAHAACAYYHHLCDSLGIDAVEPYVTSRPLTRESVTSLLPSLSSRWNRPEMPFHLSVFGAAYQLETWEKIMTWEPRLSCLWPLQQRSDQQKPGSPDFDTTWSLEAVAYPPSLLISDNDCSRRFLARMYTLADALVPLVLNLNAAANRQGYFHAHFYHELEWFRKSLSDVRAIVDSDLRPFWLPTFNALRSHDPGGGLDQALQLIAANAVKLQALVEPASYDADALTYEQYREAQALAARVLADVRAATDPDRPLDAKDWGRLIDDPVTKQIVSLDLHDIVATATGDHANVKTFVESLINDHRVVIHKNRDYYESRMTDKNFEVGIPLG